MKPQPNPEPRQGTPNEASGTATPESSGSPLPGCAKRGRRLKTIAHVKAGAAAALRRLELLDDELRAGTLDPRRANSRIYALSTAIGGYQALANIMSGDVAADVAELREQLLGLGDRPATGRVDTDA